MIAPPAPLAVVWHDLECHGYAADLPLWHELARRERGPVLDVGAGTGRVALDLAAAGHTVTALDRDPVLLGALSERAAKRDLTIATVAADAQDFDLAGERFGLIVVPMQTVQLLADRTAFLAAARRHVLPGGLLAAVIAEELEDFGSDPHLLPDADAGVIEGWRFESQPVAIRVSGGAVQIERVRTVTAPAGHATTAPDVVELAALGAAQLEAEAAGAGFAPEPRAAIPATTEHVGATVVMLRG